MPHPDTLRQLMHPIFLGCEMVPRSRVSPDFGVSRAANVTFRVIMKRFRCGC